MDIFTKYPAEVWDYDVDFCRALPDGDTLESVASVTVAPPESMVTSPMNTMQPTEVKVWVADGVPGASATATVIATTVQGRVIEQKFQIRVRG